ncbi:hypothetical protein ACA910_019478 [Epithemia clementina (nom. ined.)]
MAIFSFQRLILLCTLPSCAGSTVHSWYYAQVSELRVHLPVSLSFNGASYDHRDALFGEPPNGGSITAPLYFADSTLCNDSISPPLASSQTIRFYPQSPILGQQAQSSSTTTSPTATGPFILMVNRGGCHFVQKVRNAQHLGAAGVLIADNVCLCIDKRCHNNPNGMPCEDDEPTMADDGSGRDVKIPSFLMFKHDADLFKESIITTNQTMRVEMAFPSMIPTDYVPWDDSKNIPEKSPTAATTEKSTTSSSSGVTAAAAVAADAKKAISMDLWITPADYHSKTFLSKFHPLADALGSCVDVTPHMYVIDGIKSGCMGKSDMPKHSSVTDPATSSDKKSEIWSDLPCYNLCTNGGRYCAGDPDGALEGGLSGADVVTESLRQLCIWSYYSKMAGNLHSAPKHRQNLWWDYAKLFTEKCTKIEETQSLELCIEGIFRSVGIDKEIVDQCMSDSGGLTTFDSNNKLENEIKDLKKENVFMVPTVRIGGRTFDGSFDELFTTLCKMCGQDKTPDVCTACAYCPDVASCLANGGRCAVGTVVLHHNKAGSSQWTWYDHRRNNNKNSGNQKKFDDGVSTSTLALSVLLVSTVMFMAAFWHYKRTQFEAREHIRALVADYMPLRDDGDNNMLLQRNQHHSANFP